MFPKKSEGRQKDAFLLFYYKETNGGYESQRPDYEKNHLTG